jgi:hypothetical protein
MAMRFASMGLGIVLLFIALALLIQALFNEIGGALIVIGGALIIAGALSFSVGCLGCDIIEAAVKAEAGRLAKQLPETQQEAGTASAGPRGNS